MQGLLNISIIHTGNVNISLVGKIFPDHPPLKKKVFKLRCNLIQYCGYVYNRSTYELNKTVKFLRGPRIKKPHTYIHKK